MSERYMVVTYIKKPNGMWDEVTEFKNNLKTKHIQTAKVVLDFKEKKCVVNSLNREASYEDMQQHSELGTSLSNPSANHSQLTHFQS